MILVIKIMYGKTPDLISTIKLSCKEYLSYQYLPIKLSYKDSYTLGDISKIHLEPRLECFRELIEICCIDFKKNMSQQEYRHWRIYLTAKNGYQRENCGFNRSGWHSDGFLSDDINYIWSNKQPTIFNDSKFDISPCDERSLDEMSLQARPENNFTYPNYSLLKLDQYVIHKVGPIEEGVRCFVKVSFSKNKYNLEGNSHNYELDYNWEMYPRKLCRNIPNVNEIKN